jgi:hypothetical protein
MNVFVSYSQNTTNIQALLVRLDSVVRNKQYYTDVKEQRIKQLKEMLQYCVNDEQTYKFLSKIFDEYRSFSMDSCQVYASKKMLIAKKMNLQKYLDDSNMNLAEVYMIEGMYKEALDRLNLINFKKLASYLRPYYFHLYRTTYGQMSDYSLTNNDRQIYLKKVNMYRDSLLSVNKKGTYLYSMILADGLIANNRPKEAVLILKKCMIDYKSDDALCLLAYTISLAYNKLNDADSEEYYLAISAIADIKRASKEYYSLLELSKLLFDKNDLVRAYNYLKCSMEDAAYCNARLRTIEVSKIFPIVEKAHQQKLAKKEHQRYIAIVFVSILLIVLSIVLLFLYKQMKKLSSARKHLQKSAEGLHLLNVEQTKLNEALQLSNIKLGEMNVSLVEANNIKEECISHYMDLCSIYIDKMNDYRHSLISIAKKENNAQALFNKLKSTQFIEKELADFYYHFDATFLRLFPTFVHDFNELLLEDGRIYPKEEGRLNTELRIFALIRLGITDSTKIAIFLRYSVTTIYNYRVKVRNLAKGDRNELETKVMNISAIS